MPSQTSCTLYTVPRELRDSIYASAQEEWVKNPIVWSEDQFPFWIESATPWRKAEPITYFNSSPLEIALIPDRRLYREALESRLKQSTLVLAYGRELNLEFTNYNLSKLARKCIASVVLRIPHDFRKSLMRDDRGLHFWRNSNIDLMDRRAAQLLPSHILPTLIHLPELRSLTLEFKQEGIKLHNLRDKSPQCFARFITKMSKFSTIETRLKHFSKLTTFELKVKVSYASGDGAGSFDIFTTECDCPCGGNLQCRNSWRPSWMLKGLDSVFNVKAVPEVEHPDQDLSKLRPEYVIRTWQSNKGENLIKGQLLPAPKLDGLEGAMGRLET
ncbi:hypothetical protein EAF04_010978 [Stromatinia cepivora]|nr:hypothetical protein EAF04_010978 [Stromatinia cepivora]